MSKSRMRNRWLMASLKSIFKKEFIHIFRNPATLMAAIVLPIIELLLLGSIIDFNVHKISTVVYDLANTQESRRLLERFTNTDDFRVVKRVNSDQELQQSIVSGQAKIGIKIPVDYSRRLMNGQTASVLVLVDGSNATVTAEAVNVSGRIALEESVARLLQSEDSKKNNLPVEVRSSVLFNPANEAKDYFIPGLIDFLLTGITIMLVSLSIASEREKGTLEQLYLTPINLVGMMLGKMLPYGLLALIELCVLMGVMNLIFGVQIHGNPLLLILLSLPFILTGLGIGLSISAGANTQMEAMQLAILVRVLPAVYFSGYLFPIESMPKVVQTITLFIADRHFIEVARGVILRGAGLRELWPNALALTAMSVVMFTIAVRRFRGKVG